MKPTKQRHIGSDPDVERYDPDLWTDEFAFLSQPKSRYPERPLLRLSHQFGILSRVAGLASQEATPTLVLWGKYDPSFQVAETEAFRRDVPAAEIHILDAGHFALDTDADEIADLIRAFLTRTVHG